MYNSSDSTCRKCACEDVRYCDGCDDEYSKFFYPHDTLDAEDISKPDNVNHPKHYENYSVECIVAMEETQGTEAVINFCICNAFKYLWRHRAKNGYEDIKKANWYLNKAVELCEKKMKEEK